MNQTRREFLKKSAIASAVPLLKPLSEAVASSYQVEPKQGYELLFLQTNWGYTGSLEEFCTDTKKAGYDGAELWWLGEDRAKQEHFFATLKKYDLQIAFLVGAGQSNFDQHFAKFKENLDAACSNTFQKPLYINCHSGKDYFTYEQNKKIIDYTLAKRKETGIPIYHETHRSRMLFACHIAKNFAENIPDLQITLDISHWCNVHESLLADQKESVDFLLGRVGAIHGRIGHPEGPQVNDPRAPEWDKIVKAHLEWWDKVIARKKQNGERITILTEFGPPDYMPTIPYTRQPVANQWDINVYMMNLLKQRYQ
ncbi:sugar phosphate isomerase/epimerase family protein [Pedobacter sp. MW01-1-1]|uniref:sugar phosphate isomerase/epimerase family protein n=1 Tax=Pedobacter sp. MW01-1-1 TaxID=3383027 RepID=UPI003FEDA8A8